jgi:4-hydroxy-tetrahydrodipicolinate synthase
MGPVRPPLTTFEQLGEEGEQRLARIVEIIEELNDYAAGLGL